MAILFCFNITMANKKLTLKEKSMQGFLLSVQLINFAEELASDARDFGWYEAKSLAKRMKETGEEYREKFR